LFVFFVFECEFELFPPVTWFALGGEMLVALEGIDGGEVELLFIT
jgi:hypothetical protein